MKKTYMFIAYSIIIAQKFFKVSKLTEIKKVGREINEIGNRKIRDSIKPKTA